MLVLEVVVLVAVVEYCQQRIPALVVRAVLDKIIIHLHKPEQMEWLLSAIQKEYGAVMQQA
jgi:hypothetical protein